MRAYDDGRGRRTRDVPSSRAPYYYDNDYDRAAPRSSRVVYEDPLAQTPAQPSARDRHRRKSIHADPDEPRSTRRKAHAGVSVVASDDEADHHHGKSSRDVYGSSHPDRTSRHDVESKTSDRSRHFRDKRGTWETGEAENLRRAKSYSPHRAVREAEAVPSRNASPHASKSGWPDGQYETSGHHRSSRKHRAPKQYYENDPREGYTTDPPSRSRTRDRGSTEYEYPPSTAEMPRPPMGDQAPYKTSHVASQAAPEEKPSKHSRRREKDYYGSGYDDVPTKGSGYDRGGYGVADEAPRRSRHSKKHDDKPRRGDAGYSAPTQRGRHRSLPPQDDYNDVDPYDRVQDRPRHRQSLPPRTRSGYPDDPYDTYGEAKPPRRATSVNHGDSRRSRYYDDSYGRSGGSGSGGDVRRDKKGKKWPKQAGQLFMTHAVPVIKKEAVPFLTKAAQAYMEQQRTR
ncbi:hypothetical protein VMCG_06890 [Cytospora schulzeri]|uniref:Uncharacterized protein n=1 Tax=Cytospora schulzeri TaxID=448051 RepID=A0A423W232_9PEZI|nr:hypothetical protein VMCG_06890 [Valsa malicola]